MTRTARSSMSSTLGTSRVTSSAVMDGASCDGYPALLRCRRSRSNGRRICPSADRAGLTPPRTPRCGRPGSSAGVPDFPGPPQRLPGRVVQELKGACRVVFRDAPSGCDVLACLTEQSGRVLGTRRDAFKVASGQHGVDSASSLFPPHAGRSSRTRGRDRTDTRNGSLPGSCQTRGDTRRYRLAGFTSEP
jgi:hypothetical protein